MTWWSEHCARASGGAWVWGWCRPEVLSAARTLVPLLCYLCRNSPSAGTRWSLCVCMYRCWFFCFSSVACSPVWEYLSFHLKAATMWQRTITTLSINKLKAGFKTGRGCYRLDVFTAQLLLLRRGTRFRGLCRGGVLALCNRVKMLMGWLPDGEPSW